MNKTREPRAESNTTDAVLTAHSAPASPKCWDGKECFHQTCRAFPFYCKIETAAEVWDFFVNLPNNCDGWHRHLMCLGSQIFLPPHPTRTSPGMGWHTCHVNTKNIIKWALGSNSFPGERHTEWMNQMISPVSQCSDYIWTLAFAIYSIACIFVFGVVWLEVVLNIY